MYSSTADRMLTVLLLFLARTAMQPQRNRKFRQFNKDQYCTVPGSGAAGLISTHFVKKFEGPVPPADYLDKFEVRSRLDCAESCARDNVCISLFYVQNGRHCQTHSTYYETGAAAPLDAQSGLYYEKEGEDDTTTTTTTTTMTTTTTATAVPTTPVPFTTANLPDGTTFSYSIFMDVKRTRSEAITKCVETGGTLVEVKTAEKVEFFKALFSDPVYSGGDYHTNGVYNGLTETWETATGSVIPTGSSPWEAGRPNSGGTDPCVFMMQMHGHYLDDNYCDYPSYAICERHL